MQSPCSGKRGSRSGSVGWPAAGQTPALRAVCMLGVLMLLVGCGQTTAQPTVMPEAAATETALTLQATSVAAPLDAVATPLAAPERAATSVNVQESPPVYPECAFNGVPEPEPEAPPLESYTFGEPQVIRTAKFMGISEWLPDNRTLLISRSKDQADARGEIIETVDTQTGAVQEYAHAETGRIKPRWLADQRAVVFEDYVDQQTRRVVRLADGSGAPPREVVTDIARGPVMVTPDGRHALFVPDQNDGTVRLREIAGAAPPPAANLQAVEGAPGEWRLPEAVSALLQSWTDDTQPIGAALQPGGQYLAIYGVFGVYLANMEQGTLCTITLGPGDLTPNQWVMAARWSPDGRRLALQSTISRELPVSSIGLTVIDVVNGAWRVIDVEGCCVFEVTWAPNEQHLIALVSLGLTDQGFGRYGFYLIDSISGQTRQILSTAEVEYPYYGGGVMGAIAWSSDGGQLAFVRRNWLSNQPSDVEGQLCISTISINP